MSCSGLHCSGCVGGMAVPIVPIVAFCGLAWVAEHLVEVVIVSGTCGVLAVAAVVVLMRWAGRRDTRQAVAWQQMRAREVPPAVRPALGFRDLHIHLDGVAADEQAEVIRQAINGRN